MISSLREKNIIASEEKLKQEGKSIPKYVTELIKVLRTVENSTTFMSPKLFMKALTVHG